MKALLSVLLVSSAALVFLTGSRAPLPDTGFEPTRLVRTLDLDGTGVVHPAGLAFSPEDSALLVLHAGDGSPIPGSAEIVTISLSGDFLGSRLVSQETDAASGLLYDGGASRLLPTGSRGDRWLRDEIDSLASPEPFLVANTDLLPMGLEDALGIAFHPTTGHLYALTSDQRLHELTASGNYLGARDVSALGLRDPRGLVFAPSGDTTDDPSRMSLYVGDTRPRTARKAKKGTDSQLAVIVEASLTSPTALPTATPTFVPMLVNVIDSSRFSPPSPDTAGLAYRPDLNKLVVTDSEVNETSLFENVNVWLTTLSGTVVGTGVTSNFMEPGHEEPTGVAWDPGTGHYFMSDDSEKAVWEIDPGPDQSIGTSDDVVTSLDTTEFGSSDPEGVAFDTLRGHLYVADGVNDELYRILPGANGVFDGVPPDGDDVLRQFDTEMLGIHDPEGVEHNPDDDTLFISGSDFVAETTINGLLLRLIDLRGIGIDKPAGLAYARASDNAGFMHLYVAARGDDNDSDGNQNDGKIYELTLVDEPGVLDIRVDADSDDAEEEIPSGEIKLGGGDLELGFDDEDQQTVGIRFNGVDILRNTPILESYVQFTAEDESNESTQLTLRGQLTGNAPTFDSSDYDVSSRPTTQASVSWSPQPWNTEGAAGASERTPDLSAILQEIVNQPSWSVGGSLVLTIKGTGWRVAESYDGMRDAAPLLHVRFPPPNCGNGDREIGEQCDGSDFGSADCSVQGCSGGSLSCTNLCRFDTSTCTGCPVCGNNDVEFGEECDDGNTTTEECLYQESACQVCDAACNIVPGATSFCGDGIVDSSNGEECDDTNLDDTDACTSTCQAAVCGDGYLQAGVEECDDDNANNGDACLDTCVAAFCGDGFVRAAFEQCDDANLDNTDACLDTCVSASCGDGFVESGVEACDDANLDDTDACLTTCAAATCGDGYPWAGVEECDDANLDNSDACLDSCTTASCGDGFTQTGVEQCDDANADNGDGCLNSCVAASCGDGFLWAGIEECDDANADDADACLTTCQAATCGDGLTWAGVEACDDANGDETDACLASCEAASCGDGIVWAGVETCDDGNSSNTDACLEICTAAFCGDAYVWDTVEECDDGNLDNTDGCLDICVVPEPPQTLLLLSALALVGGLARKTSSRGIIGHS